MSKSKYPNKIDSSLELPIVRDNIMQIGSEAINSLRSAIIQIEKTLGVLPNGSVSITVSDRLSKSLDDLGNLKKEAISALNLLSGPIKNKDVAEKAEIEESKLNLDYSTKNLYGQLSNLKEIIDSFAKEIRDLSLLLSIHINSDKVGAHRALNINVEELSSTPSNDATTNLAIQSLQEFLQSLISNHIFYSGENISLENSSHNASQIFYDSQNSPLSSSSVQGAIDELSGVENTVVRDLKDIHFDNSYLKKNTFQISSSFGRLIQSNLSLEYFKYDVSSDSIFTEITYSGTLNETPSKFDIIQIGSSAYRIFDVDTVNLKIKIFGLFLNDSLTSITGSLYKNNYGDSSPAGLKIVPVFDNTISFSKIAKIISPNSTYIISDIIYPSKIDSSNNKFTINIDNLISLEFNVLDSVETNIDSIINSINSQASYNNFPISSFKINTEYGSRIGIACDFENSSSKIYYINLSSSSSCLDYIGLSSYQDMNIYGDYGSKYIINGNEDSSFQTILSSSDLSLSNGSNVISSSGTDINFLEYGIKKNDLVLIHDRGADSGTYIVSSVSAEELRLLLRSGKTFSGVDGELFNILIQKNSIGFDSIEGTSLSSSSNLTFFVELFLDSNKNLFYNKYIEYENIISGTSPLFDVIYAENDIEKQDISFSINLFNSSVPSDGLLFTFGDNQYHIDKNVGEYKFEMKTPDGKSVSIFIYNLNGLISSISSLSYNSTFIVNKSLNNDIYLNLGVVKYDKFRGLLTGNKLNFSQIQFAKNGIISKNQISDNFINQYIDIKFDDLRSNGVISGLEILSQTINSNGFYEFTVNSGIAYVKGKRFLIKKQIISTQILASSIDKIFISINDKGNIVFDGALSATCSCPFDNEFYCVIATIEYDGTNSSYIDLRLFISDLDFKILNEISVSPVFGMAHFDDINKALSYAKRFTELFPGVGTPTVHLKSGRYIIKINHSGASSTRFTSSSYDEVINQGGLWLDFPVIIRGEGDTSIIDVSEEWSDTTTVDRYTEFENRGGIYIAGSGTSTLPSIANYTKITSGKIILKDLTIDKSRIYLIDPKIDNGGAAFEVSYEFINVTFDGNPDSGTPNKFDRQCIFVKELSTSGLNRGNFVIDRCSFLKCGIFLDGDSNFFKNIIISNNSWTALANEYDVLISQNDVFSKIIDTSNYSTFSNINIFSNICKTFYSSGNQIICAAFSNITDTAPVPFGFTRMSNYFSGNVLSSESLYARDSVFSDKIQIFNTSDTSTIANNTINLSSTSATTGVIVRNDLNVWGDLDVSGTATFNATVDFVSDVSFANSINTLDVANLDVVDLNISGTYSGPAIACFLGRVNGIGTSPSSFSPIRFLSKYPDYNTTYGYPNLTDTALGISSQSFLPCSFSGTIKRITLKNLDDLGLSTSGEIRVYKISQLDNYRVVTNWTQIMSSSYNLIGFDSDRITGSGSFSENDVLIFVMISTSGGYIVNANIVLEYNI